MTSKQSIEDPQVKALPISTRRVRASLSNPFFSLLGAALVGAGVSMGAFRTEAPFLESFFTQVETFGLGPGSLVGFGLVTFALGVLGGSVRRQTKTLIQQDELERAIGDLGADTTLLGNQMQELRGDQLESKNGLAALRNELREWRSKDRSGELNDSLFRLAASLDQLHARIDKRIDVLANQITSQFEDQGQLVEASRDFLQESLEHTEERLTHPAGPSAEEFQAFAQELRATLHELGQDPFEGERVFDQGESSALTFDDAPLPPVKVPAEAEHGSSPIADPLAEPAGTAPGADLGLLDQLDDEGVGTWEEDEVAPATAEAPSESDTWQAEAPFASSAEDALAARPTPDASVAIDPSPTWNSGTPTQDAGPTEVDLDHPPAALPGPGPRAAAPGEGEDEGAASGGESWRSTGHHPWFPPSPPQPGA